MPIYEYRCSKCGHEDEIFQNYKEKPKRKCTSCGKLKFERLISKTLGFVDPGITTLGKLAEVNSKKNRGKINEEEHKSGTLEKKRIQNEYKRINKMTDKEKIRYIEEG